MAKKGKKKVPEIRFRGFAAEWEQVSLGEVLTERNVLQKISDDAPIRAFASGQGVIDRSERKSNNRDHLTLDQANKLYKLTEYDDIVYNPANLKYGAIDRNKLGRGVISPIYVTFTTKHEPSFIEPIVKSERFQLRALLFEEGTVVKRQSVSPENLLSLKVTVTPCPTEQEKIGSYFKSLDQMIGLHQRKHDKLVTLKQAMLNKMFPQDGTTTPEIRFKGFEGEWVESVFKDFAPRMTEASSESDLPRLEYEDIVSGIGGLNKDLTKKASDKSGIKFKTRDVLFGKLRPYLKNWFFADFEGIAVGDFWVLRSKNAAPSFIYRLIQTERFEKVANQSSGSKMPRADWPLVSNTVFRVPADINEQEQIGVYFLNLDKLISKHATQLEKLKNIKSACLEKMFV
ncbi:hypothetical protein ACSYAD_25005 [Acaryochloris marina NIES-2412]|uniref:hypothetical protein n=1 Tax=Acaryochloris marina TaxID=155978 RepID=UPI004058C35A